METVEIIIEETVTPITLEVYDGVPGDSAYVVAVKNGFVGTEAEWLESLKGADGTGGGVWGSITGTLANQTDLVTALNTKVDKVTGYTLTKNDFTDILKAKLDSITEIFTTALKTAYDGAVTWISTNGSNLISHLSNTSNPHNTTALQVGAYTTSQVDTLLADANINSVEKLTVKLSEAINKGQAVYISSANGTNIIVSKASNSSEATSSKTLGLLETSGATNAIVNVITEGPLGTLDTSTATIGDSVWLGTSGYVIFGLGSKPVAPAHLVYIGVVSRVHATNGEILVKVQNGFEMNEIHDFSDVSYASPIDTDSLMVKDVTNSLWKRLTFANLNQYLKSSSSLIKLLHRANAPSSTIVSSTANTILANIPLVGGTLSAEDCIYLDSLTVTKTGTGGTTNIRIYISPNNNSLTGATQIGALFMTATLIYAKMRKKFDIYGGNLYYPTIANITTVDDITTSSAAVINSMAYNVANTYYLIVTGQLASTADTLNISGIRITN